LAEKPVGKQPLARLRGRQGITLIGISEKQMDGTGSELISVPKFVLLSPTASEFVVVIIIIIIAVI
jgi:hypothetical protein